MEEIWKDVLGYEGFYQVSNLGNVKSCERIVKHFRGGNRILKEKLKSLTKDKDGYLRVCLCKYGKEKLISVHRLVCMSFIENPENKNQVNHINGIKYDNKINNLEWSTSHENMQHAYRTGLQKPVINNEKPVLMYSKNTNELIGSFISIAKASKHINCATSDICNVLKNRQKSVKGYYFQYKN
jgi:sulfate adenylyltransferase subunit 1 (EFTu-like GTPase family)